MRERRLSRRAAVAVSACSILAASAQAQQGARPLEELPLPGIDAQERPARPDSQPAAAAGPEPAEAPGESADPAAATGIGNDDVVAMTEAAFADTTILAAIAAQQSRFDVSPRALLALKAAGVSERVIEAMLAAETAKRDAAAAAQAPQAATPVTRAADAPADPAAAPPQMSPEAVALLTQMIEQLAAEQEAAAAASSPAPEPTLEQHLADERSPRAWVARGDERTALAPTIAQVALTDERGLGSNTLRTLQSVAGKALAFANPALGIASTLGGLFRSDDDERTAVWALAGSSATRTLDASTVFEIEFGDIPGVNPDEYQPAIVRLVPTGDNYRLVAAAKTAGSGGTPSGPIVEEPVPAELRRLGRGHYRVAPGTRLGAGEYALVLRPIVRKERGRRRNSEGSLGELLGGTTSQILYLTWDFAIEA